MGSRISLARLNNDSLDARVIKHSDTHTVDQTVSEAKKLELLKQGWILIDTTCQFMDCAKTQHAEGSAVTGLSCQGRDLEAIRFGDLERGESFWTSLKQADGEMWQGRTRTKRGNSTSTLKPDSIVWVDMPEFPVDFN
tara:strand:- start:2597 stop:3010 length:414 start_codon:yes stop_codon:yes gene_type:complete